MTTWTAPQLALWNLVQERAPGRGWQVTARDDGFDLSRDVAAELRAMRARRPRADEEVVTGSVIGHEVRFAEDGGYVVTDVGRASGRSRTGGSRSSYRGRRTGRATSSTYAWRDGWFRKVGETRSLDYDAGRDLVEELAREAELPEPRARMGWEEKGAWVMGIIGAVGALVTVVAVVVLALTGHFSG